ncbi:MAG TPA: cysteine desulfurase family protein [Candidatus Baltobacteraceae bacterium]
MTSVERIYLDNAATTPVRPEVVEAMLPYFTANGYNPSSVHAEGRAARAALDDARSRVARCLGAKSKEIVFTGGGSEADNLALIGVARALKSRGRHLISTVVEHHAVLHALEALREDGWDVTLLAVDRDGRVSPEAFTAAIRPDTVLASVMYVNNELGTVAPVRELAAAAHRHGVLFHTDAVQAGAYLPLDVVGLGVDLLSLAAHKFYGPKGTGILYVRDGTPVQAILHGGSQEFAKRAGTENVAGVVGLTTALELAMDERTESAARIATLRDAFEARVLSAIPDVRVNGGAARAPHISNLSFLGVTSEQLLMRLDIDGIAVSAGSACASGAVEPSHVIAALGLPERWMRGVIRFSLGRTTSRQQIDRAAEVLEQAVADLRSISPAPA